MSSVTGGGGMVGYGIQRSDVSSLFSLPYPTYNTEETGFEFHTHCFNDGLRLTAPASTGM